jgi:acetyltransferase EpsM
MRSHTFRSDGNAAKPCIILGCGGHGRVVLDILVQARQYQAVGFVDSDPNLTGRRIDGLKVLGRPDDLPAIGLAHGVQCAIVAVGDNGARRELADRLDGWGFELINAVHPSANLARNVNIGTNVVVAAGALVCAHCQIGDSVILNTGSIIDHESLIGTGTHVCPGARIAGRVTIESGAFVGIGATVIQSVRVGYEAVVGAGAVVIRDVAPMSTVVGVPAREIKCIHKTSNTHELLMPELLGAAAQSVPLGIS